MDCLPVLGQLTLRLVRSARFFGRAFPSYKSARLCFSIGPLFNITETAMSCVPPHLLQRAKILYLVAQFFVVGVIASCMPSFSCMAARIVRCFGHSVKDKERAILATRPVANKFKNRIRVFIPPWANTAASLTTQRFTALDESKISRYFFLDSAEMEDRSQWVQIQRVSF
jgi:hypothetical protein